MNRSKLFRKKPVMIEAMRFIGAKNAFSCLDFIRSNEAYYDSNAEQIGIPTLEGTMTAAVGDWIIKGVNGEFYPCKPDVFEKTYEVVITND